MTRTLAFAFAIMLGAGNMSMAQCGPGQCEAIKPLINDGGLENCSTGKLPQGWGVQAEGGAKGAVTIDDKQAHSGKQSMLVNLTSPSGYLHPCISATLKPGSYILRVWAKADPAQSFVMQVYDARGWATPKPANVMKTLTTECQANNSEWSKCELEINATDELQASIQIGLTKQGKLWLDDFEIVPAKRAAGVEFLQKGDESTLSNKHLSAVMKKGSRSVELNYPSGDGFAKACGVLPAGAKGEQAASIDGVNVVYNSADKIILDVSFKGGKGSKMGLRLIGAKDKPFVETQPLGATTSLRIEHSAQVSIMPDVRGNDLVIRPENFTQSKLRLPFALQTQLLNFIDNGDAILMCLWQSAERQKATLELQGEGAKRMATATVVDFDKVTGENVWVAILSAPGIWHQAKMAGIDVKGAKLDWKDRPLDGKIHWKADFRREPDGLIETWSVIRQNSAGNWPGCLPGKGRTVWCTYSANFPYPAYFEGDSAYLANSSFDGTLTRTCYKESGDITFDQEEPVIIYPYEYYSPATGSPMFVLDILRAALSDTREATLHERIYPKCIPTHRFSVTCSNTKKVEDIFAANTENEKTDEVVRLARHLRGFVWSVRERIEEQVAWANDMRKFCAERKAANPKLAPMADMLDETLARIPAIYKKQLPGMKQPDICGKYIDMIDRILLNKSEAETVAIAKEMRALGAEIKPEDEKDRIALVKTLGSMIRTVGGSQDQATGCMRQVVKALHQQAGIASLTASDDATFDFISEIRNKTTAHMSVYGGHEPGIQTR